MTGKPVFHWLLKPFILKAPKKLVFGSYGSGWFHTLAFPLPGMSFPPEDPSHFPCLSLLCLSDLSFHVLSCGRGGLPSPHQGKGPALRAHDTPEQESSRAGVVPSPTWTEAQRGTQTVLGNEYTLFIRRPIPINNEWRETA